MLYFCGGREKIEEKSDKGGEKAMKIVAINLSENAKKVLEKRYLKKTRKER